MKWKYIFILFLFGLTSAPSFCQTSHYEIDEMSFMGSAIEFEGEKELNKTKVLRVLPFPFENYILVRTEGYQIDETEVDFEIPNGEKFQVLKLIGLQTNLNLSAIPNGGYYLYEIGKEEINTESMNKI